MFIETNEQNGNQMIRLFTKDVRLESESKNVSKGPGFVADANSND